MAQVNPGDLVAGDADMAIAGALPVVHVRAFQLYTSLHLDMLRNRPFDIWVTAGPVRGAEQAAAETRGDHFVAVAAQVTPLAGAGGVCLAALAESPFALRDFDAWAIRNSQLLARREQVGACGPGCRSCRAACCCRWTRA